MKIYGKVNFCRNIIKKIYHLMLLKKVKWIKHKFNLEIDKNKIKVKEF